MGEINVDELAQFHKRKRKKRKMILAIATTILLVLACILFFVYYITNVKSYVGYVENSQVKYSVELNESDTYQGTRVGEDFSVISRLIKNVVVNFKYDLNLNEIRNYTYNYQIIVRTELKEKGQTKLIHNSEEVIKNEKPVTVENRKLEIAEQFNVAYKDYNDKIVKILEQDKIPNTISELNIIMKLTVVDNETNQRINKESEVMSISIPLDVKTVDITKNENVDNSAGKIEIQNPMSKGTKWILYLAIILFISGTVTLILLYKYISKTRSANKMYTDEIKRIVFDYKSYVQKINTPINYNDYKIVKVDTFNELMQMREELQSPILMYNEKSNLKTIFMIIKDDMLFAHAISAKAIKERLIEESKKRKKEEQGEMQETPVAEKKVQTPKKSTIANSNVEKKSNKTKKSE